ncbi:MAG: VOC family protein [Bacteroidetes bacterium]|nr:VOC family protein [Bacteroidota bacterium]
MKLTSLSPMLQVDYLQKTIDYYVTVLGFTSDAHEPGWGWASLIKDEINIMLALPNQHIPYHHPLLTGSIYLRTDDVDAWWSKLKNNSEIVYPIEDFEYGLREFAIKDCNGYILQFGQNKSQVDLKQNGFSSQQ